MNLSLKYKLLCPFYPLIQFFRIQVVYGWVSGNYLRVFFIWSLKCILLEPLRLLEAAVMAILPERKVKPVFILGFYRSGTTYLQELLSADPNHSTLTLFQSLLPEISLCFGWLFEPIFTLVCKVFRIKNEFHNIPLYGKFPGEEDLAINALSTLYDYNKVYYYPSKYKEIADRFLNFRDEQDAAKWKEQHQYLVQKLSYIYGSKKIILKSPPNTARIDALKEMYPDAQFVFISRNPADAIPASKRLWELNRRFSFESFDDAQVLDIIVDQYLSFHELYRAQKAHVHCPEIRFAELVGDTGGVMKGIYGEMGWKGWESAEPRVRAIENVRKQGRVRKYQDSISEAHVRREELELLKRTLGYISG